MSDETERIEPCPFCGSQVVDICRTNEHACWVRCANDECGAETNSRPTRKEAIAVWNTRTPRLEPGCNGDACIEEDDDKDFAARFDNLKR